MSLDSENFTIDLRRLRLLREVDRRGTVAATATALHLTPSAVSQQLAGLARELDVPLLERVGRGVRLTGQGRVLLAHADAVVRPAGEGPRGPAGLRRRGGRGGPRSGPWPAPSPPSWGRRCGACSGTGRGCGCWCASASRSPPSPASTPGDLDVVVCVDHPGGPRRDDARYDRVDLLTDVLDVLVPTDHPWPGTRRGGPGRPGPRRVGGRGQRRRVRADHPRRLRRGGLLPRRAPPHPGLGRAGRAGRRRGRGGAHPAAGPPAAPGGAARPAPGRARARPARSTPPPGPGGVPTPPPRPCWRSCAASPPSAPTRPPPEFAHGG